MSRHRHFRNMNVDDYLDDYDVDQYDHDDYDDDQTLPTDANDPKPAGSPPPQQQQQQQQQQEAASEPLEDNVLDEILHQFRDVLSDDTLTRQQVDAALSAADYDWETALVLLRTRLPVSALPADPSPIAHLLTADDNEHSHSHLHNPAHPAAAPAPFSGGRNAAHIPDYEAFVADLGTTLYVSPDAKEDPPFAFDKPSPDDVIRAKQARGASRAVPPLRLPKPAAAPVRADLSSSSRDTVPDSARGDKPAPPTTKARKPIRLPPRAADPPTRAVPDPTVQQQQQQQRLVRQRMKPVDQSKRVASTAASLSVVVAGHVDAGKSTLIGHLLEKLASASSSSSTNGSAARRRKHVTDFAWATDDDPVERDRGVTIDIASRVIIRPGDPPRTMALIDAPGHRDFVPAMILGAAQAGAALLVVDASPGEFEAGFAEHGQTREHAIVLKAFGVSSLIVVVNKMDVAEYAQERFDEVREVVGSFLRSNGWKSTGGNLKYVPVSGREGVNLTTGPGATHPMSKWYDGLTLIQELDSLPVAKEAEVKVASGGATRLVVTDFFRSATMGGQMAVTGRLLRGSVAPRDKLTAVPGAVTVTVKSVMVGEGARTPVAVAGLDAAPVTMGLTDLPDGAVLAPGCVLCDPQDVATAARLVRVRLLVTGVNALVIRGTRGVLHVGGASEAANVAKLCEYTVGKKGATKGGGKKRIPRRLVRGDSAIVEIACERAVAMERMEDVKALGKIAFRLEGRTVAVGVVMEILRTEKDEQDAERQRKNEEGGRQ